MRKNIVISLQEAELALLDFLAENLGLSRSACVRLLVARYYKDEKLTRFWKDFEEGKAATNRENPPDQPS
jgi:hypothetical protein